MRGIVIDNVLVKRGGQVVKFFKLGGYGVAVKDLDQVRGVKLYTKYDGILYADRHVFYKYGIDNSYGVEDQKVLPVKHWEVLQEVNRG